mmetsp:Transcript_24919/g.54320  ORF Transcript_24919/g.54320 Transcript_24919/m.54320 type:complete len:201 (-) Transcript_24919:444-1046(-)
MRHGGKGKCNVNQVGAPRDSGASPCHGSTEQRPSHQQDPGQVLLPPCHGKIQLSDGHRSSHHHKGHAKGGPGCSILDAAVANAIVGHCTQQLVGSTGQGGAGKGIEGLVLRSGAPSQVDVPPPFNRHLHQLVQSLPVLCIRLLEPGINGAFSCLSRRESSHRGTGLGRSERGTEGTCGGTCRVILIWLRTSSEGNPHHLL